MCVCVCVCVLASVCVCVCVCVFIQLTLNGVKTFFGDYGESFAFAAFYFMQHLLINLVS